MSGQERKCSLTLDWFDVHLWMYARRRTEEDEVKDENVPVKFTEAIFRLSFYTPPLDKPVFLNINKY